VKVGGADLAADLRTIRILRSALGDQIRLMIDHNLDHAGPILTEPAQVQDGHVVIPERPGSGIEWDETVIKRVMG